MAYLEWQTEFDVGQEQIDGDHRALVGILNQVQVALDQGKDKAEISKILHFLKDQTVNHFGTEEALMIHHNYPGASAHFAEHADLIVQMSDFLDDYRVVNYVGADALLAFLKTWLMNHIQGMDRELCAFLGSRRIQG